MPILLAISINFEAFFLYLKAYFEKIVKKSLKILQIRERSSITSAHWRGVGGLTEIADAADALRGGGGSQVKIADVILEQIF